MNGKEIELEQLLAPTVDALGFTVWGLEYVSAGRHTRLRVYIEGSTGVSVDDCACVSREIGALLDIEDPISRHYTLEVSSPGVDRVLFKAGQFRANIGQQLEVRLNFPFEGQRKFDGLLSGYRNDELILQVNDNEYSFPVENVKRARIKPHYQ